LEDLPRIDAILLSHYHEDHFDREVEENLSRGLPIITTPHAHECLTSKGDDSFKNVHALDFWDNLMLDIEQPGVPKGRGSKPSIKITGMPGKHVPPGPLSVANDLLSAVPPTNGWMIELGYSDYSESGIMETGSFENGYRIYISGDTLMVDELKEIPERYKDQNIDLMLIHLGGTTIPGPKMPLLMVTMDAKQGVQLMQLINPDITIPIHYDDYDVFMSPLNDFKKAVHEAGLDSKVVYLDRKDQFNFNTRGRQKVQQSLDALPSAT
jgi:L-ascorbate metabolism protein UlaG (beta-lactamase superfamily)